MCDDSLTDAIEQACLELCDEGKRVVRSPEIRERMPPKYEDTADTAVFVAADAGKFDRVELRGIEQDTEGWKYRLSCPGEK